MTTILTQGDFCGKEGLRGGHLSFRAHSQAFLNSMPTIKPKFDELDREMTEQISQVLANDADCIARNDVNALAPDFQVWFKAIARSKKSLLVLANELPEHELKPSNKYVKSNNRFAQRLLGGPLIKLKNNPEFISYRLLISIFYELLPIMSFRPIDRFALCYLVAQGCEQNYNINWKHYLEPNSMQFWLNKIGNWFKPKFINKS